MSVQKARAGAIPAGAPPLARVTRSQNQRIQYVTAKLGSFCRIAPARQIGFVPSTPAPRPHKIGFVPSSPLPLACGPASLRPPQFICVTLKYPRVPARVSEALVLRTYPLKEADLVVSFLTRDQGKLRGVAKRARRLKSAFGAGLERLSHVRMAYFQRETRELVNLDSCELIRSQFGLVSDYWAGVALDYFAEVSEQLLPPAEPNERFFRLLLAVLGSLNNTGLQQGEPWRAVTYFSLWALRLSGWMPDLAGARRVSAESKAVAAEMLRTPVEQLSTAQWTQRTAADLRRFLVLEIESHVERKLITAQMLEGADS